MRTSVSLERWYLQYLATVASAMCNKMLGPAGGHLFSRYMHWLLWYYIYIIYIRYIDIIKYMLYLIK